jgi:hypothetical protein
VRPTPGGIGPIANGPIGFGDPVYLASGLPGVAPIGGFAPGGPIGPGGGGILPPSTPGGGILVPPDDGGGDIPTPPPTASVPEPASWAMMIVGFLAVGGALRRRPLRPLPSRVDGARHN